ncbi:uncharacterized protein LOC125557373 [Nematostella vectensis]|uniref:uncharacterized protein LOC125557373 n=1 Tax=Nematostella vectensis TaxID=45351 RepID=UPI002076D86B|nr:uncharacterized protein LOC125557373 [Nematostella vectensis]
MHRCECFIGFGGPLCEALPNSDKYQFGSHVFYLVREPQSWEDAKAMCASRGAPLAPIDDKLVNDFIAKVVFPKELPPSLPEPIAYFRLDGSDQHVTVLPLSMWVHAVATFNRDTRRSVIYQDGEVVASGVRHYRMRDVRLNKGRPNLLKYNGRMSQFLVYNKALGKDEMRPRLVR